VRVCVWVIIFGCVGRVATEEVVLQLLLFSKCVPILLYGLEACPLRKADLNVLDFVINRFFMKLFRTNDIRTVKDCQLHFSFQLPSEMLKNGLNNSIENLIAIVLYHLMSCL